MLDAGRRVLSMLVMGALLALLVAEPVAARDRYIISGASGQLGGLVVKELLRRGARPRDLILVSHTPDKLAEYARLGASVREGDVARPETLASAYAGGTKMLLISVGFGFKEPRPVLHKRAFDAAVKAGVRHIVYTSFVGVGVGDSPVAQDHRLSEAALRASGAQWTILRNGIYADMWVTGAARSMVASGRAEAPPGEKPGAPITREDCAAAAASALLNPAAINQIYDVVGPDLVTTADVARVASEVTGRKIVVFAGQGVLPPTPPPVPAPGAVGPPPPSPAAGAGLDVPLFTAAQLAAASDRFKKLTGRNPAGLRQMLEANLKDLAQ